MKKGFTLIELLAIIVILGVIALITVPIVLKVVVRSENSANQRSVELYRDAIKNAIYEYKIDNPTANISGRVTSSEDGKTLTIGDTIVKVKYDNSKIKCDTIRVTFDGKVYLWDCVVNDSEDKYSSDDVYKDGEVVYFDVANGEVCTEEDYEEENSATGYNGMSGNSCLKFYAFLDDKNSESVRLILDHNISETTWANYSSSITYEDFEGPVAALDNLYDLTEDWEGVLTPTNYHYSSEIEDSPIDYTIDYTGYKARLITAEEIAEITGNTAFNTTEAQQRGFVFDTLGHDTDEVYNREQSFYKYGWLYDRMYDPEDDVRKYGVPNLAIGVSGNYPYAYWTATTVSGNQLYAWVVYFDDSITQETINYAQGVRPVIEVLKSDLK